MRNHAAYLILKVYAIHTNIESVTAYAKTQIATKPINVTYQQNLLNSAQVSAQTVTLLQNMTAVLSSYYTCKLHRGGKYIIHVKYCGKIQTGTLPRHRIQRCKNVTSINMWLSYKQDEMQAHIL